MTNQTGSSLVREHCSDSSSESSALSEFSQSSTDREPLSHPHGVASTPTHPDQTPLSSPTDRCSSSAYQLPLKPAMKTPYPLDQQVKLLNLQTETEMLLRQLQARREQRQAVEVASVAYANSPHDLN